MDGEEVLTAVSLFAFDLIEENDVFEEDVSSIRSGVTPLSKRASDEKVSEIRHTATDTEGACHSWSTDKMHEQGVWDAVAKDSPFDFITEDGNHESYTESAASFSSTNDEVDQSSRRAGDRLRVSDDSGTNGATLRIIYAAKSNESMVPNEAHLHLDKNARLAPPPVLPENAILLSQTVSGQAQVIEDVPGFDILPEELETLPPEEEITAQSEPSSFSDAQIQSFEGDGQNTTSALSGLPKSGSSDAFYRTAKSSNGKEIVLRARSRFLFNTLREASSAHKYKRSSYGVDIEKIMLEIEKENCHRRLTELQQNQETATKCGASSSAKDSEGGLWVEKWRAKKWIDLIGDERTHRLLLRWLQQWSHAVFKTPVNTGSGRYRFGDSNASKIVPTDPYHRPHKKLLLLHGAPGLGKTTIAHVAARQAGYDVLEINASDDRSGTLVHDKIRGAIDSHRVGTKPVCIVIDEIDGAAEAGLIHVLFDILNSDSKAVQQGHRSSANIRKYRKNKSAKFLLRPIIAICNDPFVTALRSLRPLAEMLSYRRAPTPTIVSRLIEICTREKLSVDCRTLTELVDSMDGDVRCCINTLQFDLGRKQIGTGSVGQKDINANANIIVRHAFKVDRQLQNKEESIRTIIERTQRSAEFDKVMTGCFTMYPTVPYADDGLAKPVEAGEWLHFYDTISNSMYHDQHRDLAAYLSYPVGAFHSMFSSNSNAPNDSASAKRDYEAFEAKKANNALAKQLIGSASAATQQSFRNGSTIYTELVPFLMHIVNPNINPVNGSVLLQQERIMTTHTVDVMIDFAMKYIQQRCDNGTYVFRMDPPIEQLASFSSQDQDRAAIGKYLVRQFIALEMERNMRRRPSERIVVTSASHASGVKRQKIDNIDSDDVDHEDQEDEEVHLSHKSKSKYNRSNKTGIDSSSPLSDRRNINVMADEKRIKPSFISFFKPQTSVVSTGLAAPGSHSRQGSWQEWQERMRQEREGRVWVQFHEGFSNAVRKPVSWSEFWRDL
ncbi:hypothetical protein V1525DRAFT_398165 [Lipomyces kononenkoae]|uniref:Uncharacterized protein n=1 Tax=Lipomyces kononenkoae TaxID=34357 RepID=A0ACC3T668_LIPKO